jgi:hypothetical protein
MIPGSQLRVEFTGEAKDLAGAGILPVRGTLPIGLSGKGEGMSLTVVLRKNSGSPGIPVVMPQSSLSPSAKPLEVLGQSPNAALFSREFRESQNSGSAIHVMLANQCRSITY